MKRQSYNEEKYNITNAKKDSSHYSHCQKKGMIETRPTGSGFNSFLRWFKKNEKIRQQEHNKNTNTTSTKDKNSNTIIEKYESNETLSPPSSPLLNKKRNSNSSCDSVFSTATIGFSFIPPNNYHPYGDASQPEKLIAPGPYTETYKKRIAQQENIRETDKKLDLTLRRKYQLQFSESRNELDEINKYSDLSLPTKVNKKSLLDSDDDYEDDDNGDDENENELARDANQNPNENKIRHPRHRRTCSDSSKDKKAGSYVHVKGKRKAPPPPSTNPNNNRNNLYLSSTLTPTSTLGRKKRRAPAPPHVFKQNNDLPETIFKEGLLLDDKEIKAIIESTKIIQNQTITQLPITTDDRQTNETIDKELTDEQKNFVLDSILKVNITDQKSNNSENIFFNDTLKLERGMLRSNKDVNNKKQDEDSHKESIQQQPVPPLSPISPRPWYKRPLSGSRESTSIPFKKEIVLKTVDKRRNKNKTSDSENNLPEVGYSRNSLFEGATAKLGFFGAKLLSSSSSSSNDDKANKKLENQEKRKSGIGIPSISELDREAAEIVNKEHACEQAKILKENEKYYKSPQEFLLESQMLSSTTSYDSNVQDDDKSPKSAKDLITKFESSANSPKVTINTSFIGRKEFFSSQTEVTATEQPELINEPIIPAGETKKLANQQNILGMWTCPYCTLENPNWRIICEVCEKIKPYDLRFNKTPISTSGPAPIEQPQKLKLNADVEKKTEIMRKYFNLKSANTSTLSKSSSETSLGQNPKSKLIKTNEPSYGSPKFGLRNISNHEVIRTQTSLDESKLNRSQLDVLKESKHELIDSSDVVVSSHKADIYEPETIVTIKNESINIKTDSTNDLLQSQEELEKEKERLREMIRQMNAKALAEKYPIDNKNKRPDSMISTTSTSSSTPSIVGVVPKTTQQCSTDATKLGAIKKLFTRKETGNAKTKFSPDDSRLLPTILKESGANTNIQVEKLTSHKVKINENVQPIYENIPQIRDDDNDDEDDGNEQKNHTADDRENVSKISEELISKQGLEDFKATLRHTSSKSMISNSNTLAINKLIRQLEVAISEGDYELAANLAKNLAQMKVSLCVTRQKDRPISKSNPLEDNILIDLLIVKKKTSHLLPIRPSSKIIDLKVIISNEYNIPVDQQILIFNNDEIVDGDQTIFSCGITKNSDQIILRQIETTTVNDSGLNSNHDKTRDVNYNPNLSDSENDISDNQNIDDDIEEDEREEEEDEDGAKALPNNTGMESLKIGWVCTLCTLINSPPRLDCLACSHARPINYRVPDDYQPTANNINSNSNDLNKTQTTNRLSTEIFNIRVDEQRTTKQTAATTLNEARTKFDTRPTQSKIPIKTLTEPKSANLIGRPSNTSIVMTVLNNPNITRNKYRGVDNFNPKFAPFKPLEPIRQIEINAHQQIDMNKLLEPQSPHAANHYHELLNLDNKELITNIEPFECPICFTQFNTNGEGIVLRDCLHLFCRECLIDTIKFSEEPEVKCPYMDNDYSCDSLVQEREIKSLVTIDMYEKHLMKSIRHAEHKIENAFHCKTPNCRGWCIYEDNVNQFKCPVCQITNCLTCQAIHDGLDCKQYQDRLNSGCDSNIETKRTKDMLQEMVDKGEAMNCPTCQVILMKKWGCDWLKCSMCKTEICWVTRGPRWGAGGKGDLTGGCKCGVNGKKCHEKCNYCH